MAEIKKIYKDDKILTDVQNVMIGHRYYEEDPSKVLIATDQLEYGDKISLLYEENKTTYDEAIFLSLDHPHLYKDLAVESEIEWISNTTTYEHNFEMIVRGVARWDKRFNVDEYYAFGIRQNRFYFAKVSNHEEGVNSYGYKQLFNLETNPEELIKHFHVLSAEQRKVLFLEDASLLDNNKYKVRCEIKNDKVSMKIQNTSSNPTFETEYPWVTVFENVSIRQQIEVVSSRDAKLEIIVAAAEPFAVIDGKGLFGFTAPNTNVKVYRYEVIPYDTDIETNKFNDEQYSREVSSEFAQLYRNYDVIKLNASDSFTELQSGFQEFPDVIGKTFRVDQKIKQEDIQKIQINNINQIVGENYEDKVVDIITPLNSIHNGSIITAFVDGEDTSRYGQNDVYIDLEELTDGVSETYDLPNDFITRMEMYPNAKLGDILLEVDESIVFNKFDIVGIQKNPEKFIDYTKLNEIYGGRKFYMETETRGRPTVHEIGLIGGGNFQFKLDQFWSSANDSYDAIWKYNLANFLDTAIATNLSLAGAISGSGIVVPEGFEYALSSVTISAGYEKQYTQDSFGVVFSSYNRDTIKLIQEKAPSVTENFLPYDTSLDPDIKQLMENGVPVGHIKTIMYYFNNVQFEVFNNVILTASDKQYENFETAMEAYFDFFGYATNIYGSIERFVEYRNFRKQWIINLDYNSHITTNGISKRKFFIGVSPDKYSINLDSSQLIFEPSAIPPSNREIKFRVFYDNIITLTNSYQTVDEFYVVPDSIKKLYDNFKDSDKGVIRLLENFAPSEYGVMEQDAVTFITVPNTLNENQNQLYVDVDVCSPFVDEEGTVKRKARAPLKRVAELLQNDFESSIYDDTYQWTFAGTESELQGLSGNIWNREDDWVDFAVEFLSGAWGDKVYEYSMPRLFPLPDTVEKDSFYSISGSGDLSVNDPFDGEEYANKSALLYQLAIGDATMPTSAIDKYLNVKTWLNLNNSKLGPFYKKVMDTIVKIKSSNRVYSDQTTLAETADPFKIGNWFDGFYSGTIATWEHAFEEFDPVYLSAGSNNFDFGYFIGSPWGTQNSRKQMIDQLRQTLDGKFSDYELYYVDETDLTYYQEYRVDNINSELWDTDLYVRYGTVPLSDSYANDLIVNPYIPQDNLEYYSQNVTITGPNGETIFDPNDLSDFTNQNTEFPNRTLESYGNPSKMNIKVKNVVREIENGVDMYWNFNSAIVFQGKNALPIGVEVNGEYEYDRLINSREDNAPQRIVQKVNLGKSNGELVQKFPNPEIMASHHIPYSQTHRIWLDNYDVNQFEVFALGNASEILMTLPPNFESKKDLSIKYKISNYFDLKEGNLFVEDFRYTRDLQWIRLTKDIRGYTKSRSGYNGFIEDYSKIEGEDIYHMDTFSEGLSGITVGATATSSDLIRAIQVGADTEDIMNIITLRRNNNFTMSIDVYYDDDVDRDLMQTDIVFRGQFNNINGQHYMNEYYSISLGLQNYSVALIARKSDENGVQASQVLAGIGGESSILKRGEWFTIKLELKHDVLRVFFNERNQEEKFYFSYHLKLGHSATDVEAVAEGIYGNLNVKYELPKYYINGDRIGIKALSSKTNFSNLRLFAHEESTLKLDGPMDTVNYDDVISQLKKTYGETGTFRRIRRTPNGYEYLQVGNTLFCRRNGGTYIAHNMYVEEFDTVENKVYVREKIKEESRWVIVNAYEQTMSLTDSIVVDGTQFVNEPLLSYLVDTNQVATKLERFGENIFITVAGECYFVNTWDQFDNCVWEEVSAIWDIFGTFPTS